MKFMLILKSTKDSEAGKMPSEETINAMVKYNQEQAKAGVLVDAAGLYPVPKARESDSLPAERLRSSMDHLPNRRNWSAAIGLSR